MFSRKRPARTANRTFLRVECLEDRLVPAGNVHAALLFGTLTLTGDPQANHIAISQPAFGELTITPESGTTVNGQAGPVTFSGVSGDLNINLDKGPDEVDFDLSQPISLPGNLNINYAATGGDGAKTTQTINATHNYLTVAGHLLIRYAPGDVTTHLDNVNVGGNLTVSHGVGDSVFTVDNVAGPGAFSTVGWAVTVNNTQGMAQNSLFDTNVLGSVAFSNGLARPSDHNAGFNQIYNVENTATLATIGGSVAFSNAAGTSATGDKLGDVDVKGQVTMALGPGTFKAAVQSVNVHQAPVIESRLIISGTGSDNIALGKAGIGLQVDGRLNLQAGSRGDQLDLEDVQVGRAASIATGAGDDTVTIDGGSGSLGSVFTGPFSLTTGAGADTVRIASGAGGGATVFKGSVQAGLGVGADALFLATSGTVRFEAPTSTPVVFDGGPGADTETFVLGHLPDRVPTFLRFI
jgi:hypothetical protein